MIAALALVSMVASGVVVYHAVKINRLARGAIKDIDRLVRLQEILRGL